MLQLCPALRMCGQLPPTGELQGFGLPQLNGDRSTTARAKGTAAIDTTGNDANPPGWVLGLHRATRNEAEDAGSITLSHICLLWGLLLPLEHFAWACVSDGLRPTDRRTETGASSSKEPFETKRLINIINDSVQN